MPQQKQLRYEADVIQANINSTIQQYNDIVIQHGDQLKGKYELIQIPQGGETYEKFLDKSISQIQTMIQDYINYIKINVSSGQKIQNLSQLIQQIYMLQIGLGYIIQYNNNIGQIIPIEVEIASKYSGSSTKTLYKYIYTISNNKINITASTYKVPTILKKNGFIYLLLDGTQKFSSLNNYPLFQYLISKNSIKYSKIKGINIPNFINRQVLSYDLQNMADLTLADNESKDIKKTNKDINSGKDVIQDGSKLNTYKFDFSQEIPQHQHQLAKNVINFDNLQKDNVYYVNNENNKINIFNNNLLSSLFIWDSDGKKYAVPSGEIKTVQLPELSVNSDGSSITVTNKLSDKLQFNSPKEINFTNPALSVAWYVLIGIDSSYKPSITNVQIQNSSSQTKIKMNESRYILQSSLSSEQQNILNNYKKSIKNSNNQTVYYYLIPKDSQITQQIKSILDNYSIDYIEFQQKLGLDKIFEEQINVPDMPTTTNSPFEYYIPKDKLSSSQITQLNKNSKITQHQVKNKLNKDIQYYLIPKDIEINIALLKEIQQIGLTKTAFELNYDMI